MKRAARKGHKRRHPKRACRRPADAPPAVVHDRTPAEQEAVHQLEQADSLPEPKPMRIKFERRHYQALADVYRAALVADCTRNARDLGHRPKWWTDLKNLTCIMLKTDNPRFDAGKFEEACEP